MAQRILGTRIVYSHHPDLPYYDLQCVGLVDWSHEGDYEVQNLEEGETLYFSTCYIGEEEESLLSPPLFIPLASAIPLPRSPEMHRATIVDTSGMEHYHELAQSSSQSADDGTMFRMSVTDERSIMGRIAKGPGSMNQLYRSSSKGSNLTLNQKVENMHQGMPAYYDESLGMVYPPMSSATNAMHLPPRRAAADDASVTSAGSLGNWSTTSVSAAGQGLSKTQTSITPPSGLPLTGGAGAGAHHNPQAGPGAAGKGFNKRATLQAPGASLKKGFRRSTTNIAAEAAPAAPAFVHAKPNSQPSPKAGGLSAAPSAVTSPTSTNQTDSHTITHKSSSKTEKKATH
ncbi:uncharacterized protein BJ171DRAFT_313431 [Polychytrium aggregatum]|uniref:uncharacterized protein n=1 Tax=Polychytrium aggregatum TaxID=110093 RepID=UPI0022FE0005|nr:uncharacterized protein BJ171DRAFT_313431 [Polychytrium aggregatum]KAI9193087.1 hypothetical protein BJ171DRAFT_313431 [Polychytrium aggregatum]